MSCFQPVEPAAFIASTGAAFLQSPGGQFTIGPTGQALKSPEPVGFSQTDVRPQFKADGAPQFLMAQAIAIVGQTPGTITELTPNEERFTPASQGQTLYELSEGPDPGSVEFYVNGTRYRQGDDWQISGRNITWISSTFSLDPSDEIVVTYFTSVGVGSGAPIADGGYFPPGWC